jgi:septal ring factor EnvC (AmiA/AmiB activator)
MNIFWVKKTTNFSMPRVVAFVLLSIFFFTSSAAQTITKKDIQKKKEQLLKDIEFTNSLLSETKKKKEGSINQLVTLNKQISIREELIGTISDEIGDLNVQIAQNTIQIDTQEKELAELKKAYAKMIVYAYKNASGYKRLMFVFAAKDFNQAYKRLKYLQQYSIYRKKQAALIELKQKQLAQHRLDLLNKKTSKNVLLGSQKNEKTSLSNEKGEQEGLLQTLQEKENQLKKDLRAKQLVEVRLKRALEIIVRREIDNARKKAESEGKKNVTKDNVFTAAPEAFKLNASFELNKGKLPWPVEKGVITGTFGVHPHPALKGILINNNGIDINSSKGAMARAVFEGEVKGVVEIPGLYRTVIIRHGDYLSVYTNLEEVTVKRGDKVIAKQNIGSIHTDDKDSQTELHLEIWKGENRLNPAEWLSSKR